MLSVSFVDGEREVWDKKIEVAISARASAPEFGAAEMLLRYDQKIENHDPDTGALLAPIDYDAGWRDGLRDVVVFLPNGSRFVFWRGASYVPFWAGLHNTGISYQWAERFGAAVMHPDGSSDLPEPLFDRELRYGRVSIMESTKSRVHVRWSYRLTDNRYNVWGDGAVEDYYFYPDGFGTRVITIMAEQGSRYQLTEFIVLTPQAAFPLDVLPARGIDVLTIDGNRSRINLPMYSDPNSSAGLVGDLSGRRALYRIYGHKNDRAGAIYFEPRNVIPPRGIGPIYVRGKMVAPTYWGSHWPLRRGAWTHWTIDDGIYTGPAHNSLVSWMTMPPPLFTSESRMPDMLGKPHHLQISQWAALVANTDIDDELLLKWMRSYSEPPSIKLTGGMLALPTYSEARRAIRIDVESTTVTIDLTPTAWLVNPVFELFGIKTPLLDVIVDGRRLPVEDYSWDGSVLWVKALVDHRGVRVRLEFGTN